MLPGLLSQPPRRVLMTLDAVGGVWRYGLDLARGLGEAGVDVLLVGLGPAPEPGRLRDIDDLARATLVWLDEPLDWMANEPAELAGVAPALTRLARDWRPDLLHLNLPSQAVGLATDCPIVVATHSCLSSWWAAVRGTPLPHEWHWQRRLTGAGLRRADRVIAPSASHAQATARLYGPLAAVDIVHNASARAGGALARQQIVLSAGRWWDEGKNAATLDAAAALCRSPVLMAGPLTGPGGQVRALAHAMPLGELGASSVGTLMEHAAVFAAPSLYEPFGLAVLEAAQRGAALVLADIPTFRELWSEAALFVPPRDAAGFAAAFDRLAADGDERDRLARAAGRRALIYEPARQVAATLASHAGALAALSCPLEAAE